MTCPRCKCPECRAAALNAVLGKIVSRETIPVEEINAQAIEKARELSAWRDTFVAEQFASDVVREMGVG